MGILYEKVLKMRENGRSLKPTVAMHKPNKTNNKATFENKAPIKPNVESKPKETAVLKNDDRTGGKS